MNYHLRSHRIRYVFITLVFLVWLGALILRAADRYVSPPGGYGTNDSAGGYTNWLGAATNIQWAVDKAVSPETVWVTNGTYYLTNQISIINGITMRSVNGRDVTIVNGNYRLNKNSPCVNRGTNQDWMTGSSDLDGKMRIRYGIVDMGAYERAHEATFYRFH